MEDIRKVFTIQWVGPFETFASLFEYLNAPNNCVICSVSITVRAAKKVKDIQ